VVGHTVVLTQMMYDHDLRTTNVDSLDCDINLVLFRAYLERFVAHPLRTTQDV